jgi:sugar/nucleoside kinase (ribokinase family)
MDAGFDVIVYGLVCLDTIWRTERLPPPGGYAAVLEERRTIGGEAANTAIALDRWGVRVALLGNALGDDEEGTMLRELFAREAPAIGLEFLATSSETRTPSFLLIATPDGHRTVFGRCLAPLQWPALDSEQARTARLFTMDPYAGEEGLRACDVAARAGLIIVASDCAGLPAVNTVATIVVTSSETVGPEKSGTELAAFAAGIRDQYGATTIVTWGEKGCLIAGKGGAAGVAPHLPAYVAPAVVDSTGAGDVFRAGLIYGQLQGWDLVRTARFASAAAALNCRAMGGWCGVRPVEEIEAFQCTAPTRDI